MRTKMISGERLEKINKMLNGQIKSSRSDGYAGYMALREQVEAEVQKEMDLILSAAEAQINAANAMRESAKKEIENALKEVEKANKAADVSRETATKTQQLLETQNAELKAEIAKMRSEKSDKEDEKESKLLISLDKENKKITKKVDSMIAQMNKISTKPVQVDKQVSIPAPVQIPTFDVVPVRDAAGNLIGAKVTPN